MTHDAATLKMQNVADLAKALENIVTQKLPLKVSYKLGKLLKEIVDELNFFEEKRVALVKKYGKENERGIAVDESDTENYSAFLKEYQELLELDVDIDIDKYKINLSDLPDSVELTPQQMLHLSVLFNED